MTTPLLTSDRPDGRPPANRSTPEPPRLTDDGRALLQERLHRLRSEVLAELRPLLADTARDERLVRDFERVLGEADRLEAVLTAATPLPPTPPDRVAPGSRVLIELSDGSQELIRIVHPVEAALDDERVSWDSPVASALLGARIGEAVVVRAPSGRYAARVLDLPPAAG
jgi:transcription elongation factor GreB